MKVSWRVKITILLMVAVVSGLVVTWVLNNFFLEDYYLYSKMKTLSDAYGMVMGLVPPQLTAKSGEDAQTGDVPPAEGSEAYGQGQEADRYVQEQEPGRYGLKTVLLPLSEFLSEEELLPLEIFSAQNNLTIYIYWNNEAYYSTAETLSQYKDFFEHLRAYIFPSSSANYQYLEKLKTVEGEYEIFYMYDRRLKSNYVELLYGDVEFGNYLLICSNVESMQESVGIANKFLAYAGGSVTILITLLMFVIAGSFIKPLRQLSSIAKRMSDLDFEAKYPVRTKDEIGELGQSINTLSEKLEHTISDLKRANNQLQTDIEQKVQIDEMRKEFLSNVTHELKTPIALIQGYAEGLKDNINEDAESREFYCDVIIDESMKMNKMVKKLLTLNQIEFGNYMVEMEHFDLTALLHSVLASSDILLKQNGIRLYMQPEEVLRVWADEYLIEEVFTNYLTNAIHHAANEKVIEVKAVKNGKTVRVSVFNSGQPIPEEDLEKIWIKFYKVDKARTREYGGSGIGLSIVKAIMDAHNKPFGVINHDNGVEFWFELDADV